MDLLTALFQSGRIVDLIVIIMLAELALVALYFRLTRRGLGFAALLPNMLAGLSLLLALRAALTSAPIQLVAVFLTASLFAHLWDLASRWKH